MLVRLTGLKEPVVPDGRPVTVSPTVQLWLFPLKPTVTVNVVELPGATGFGV